MQYFYHGCTEGSQKFNVINITLKKLYLGKNFRLSTFESKLNSNTSLAVQGALANRLQRRTDFKPQNGLWGLESGPTLGLWEFRTSFAK